MVSGAMAPERGGFLADGENVLFAKTSIPASVPPRPRSFLATFRPGAQRRTYPPLPLMRAHRRSSTASPGAGEAFAQVLDLGQRNSLLWCG